MSMTMSGAEGDVTLGRLWIGMHDVVDTLPINGQLRVEGVAAWKGGSAHEAPMVELVVDGDAAHVPAPAVTPVDTTAAGGNASLLAG